MNRTKNNIFFFLFFIALVLDAFAIIVPGSINRILVTFLPIPILIIRYYDLAKEADFTYMISFLFTYLGATLYISNLPYSFISAIALYLIGILLYVSILLKKIHFTRKNLISFLIFLILFLAFPILYVYNKVSGVRFFFMLIYVIGILLYFYTSVLLVKNKIQNSIYVLLSSSVYILSTFCTALLIFNYRHLYIHIIASVSFWVVHLFMNIYMTSKKTKEYIA